jgi:hypothetical protein
MESIIGNSLDEMITKETSFLVRYASGLSVCVLIISLYILYNIQISVYTSALLKRADHPLQKDEIRIKAGELVIGKDSILKIILSSGNVADFKIDQLKSNMNSYDLIMGSVIMKHTQHSNMKDVSEIRIIKKRLRMLYILDLIKKD